MLLREAIYTQWDFQRDSLSWIGNQSNHNRKVTTNRNTVMMTGLHNLLKCKHNNNNGNQWSNKFHSSEGKGHGFAQKFTTQ